MRLPTSFAWWGAISQNGPEEQVLRAKLWWAFAARSFRRTLLGALAFAGRVLPDATRRGKATLRSQGGTVTVVSNRDLLSEASSPGSAASCRKPHAGRGADAPATCSSRQHLCHGDGISG